MKKVSFIFILVLLFSIQGHAQFWISFGWNEPHCQNCLWMEQAIRMNNRQAADYHRIIHKYGQKIEKEARKHYRYWDQSARAIFKLRMERDRRLQRILSPSQFRLYVRFVREVPTRIHDYQGWFNNPTYSHYRPSDICFRYEDHYWHSDWEYAGNRWSNRFDENHWYRGKYDRPGHNDGHYRPQTPPRPNHDNEHFRPDRPARPSQPARPNRPGRPEQPVRPERPKHSNRPENNRPSQTRPDRNRQRNEVKKNDKDKEKQADKERVRSNKNDRTRSKSRILKDS